AFSDYMIGSTGSEMLIGGAGGDSIKGNGGADQLFGGPGGDELDGSGTAIIDGGIQNAGESNSCTGVSPIPANWGNCARADGVVIPRNRTGTGVNVGRVHPGGGSNGPGVEEANIYVNGSSGADALQAIYQSGGSGRVVVKRIAASGSWPSGGSLHADNGCSIEENFQNFNADVAVCELNNKPVGSIVLSGGPGTDNLSISGFDELDEAYLLGGLDRDKLTGGRYDDVLVDGDSQSTGGFERLEGGAGEDVLIANKGTDLLLGQAGGDLLMSTSLCDGDKFYGGSGDADNSQWAQLPRPPAEEITEINDWGKENSSMFGVDANLDSGRIGRHERGVNESTPDCRSGASGSWPPGGTVSEVQGVERLEASGNPDKVVGDEKKNLIIGRSGRDVLRGGPAFDKINAAEGKKSWHMDSEIDCQQNGGSAKKADGENGQTEGLTGCSSISNPVLRYGGSPPPPYEEVGDVSVSSAAYLGVEDDSDSGADAAGLLESSWEDEGIAPSALYSLNETSGNEAVDFLDPEENGTYSPDPSGSGPELGLDGPMISAPDEEAVGLDGINDEIELTDELDPAETPTSGYSVEMWAQIDPSQNLTDTALFSRGDASDGVSLHLDSDGQVVFESRRDGIPRAVRSFDFQADSEWHQMVGVIDGDRMTLFVAGIESSVVFDASALPGPTPADENTVGSDEGGNFTEMEVDTVAIYETALTLSEVLENYALGSDEPPEYIALEPVDTTDTDADTLPDDQDNCPVDANELQEDADKDGIGDACDNSTDTDGDTVDDDVDNCPAVVNSEQTDSNSDGIGDACTEAPPEAGQ
ncbi:MAG: thrombospondin type 3 repeat-containing protein, partial [Solirubrobacterales bacterium]|nr:thrombospondin type 3 repeat-containing protein [Solirubrobacterales bacterium]